MKICEPVSILQILIQWSYVGASSSTDLLENWKRKDKQNEKLTVSPQRERNQTANEFCASIF